MTAATLAPAAFGAGAPAALMVSINGERATQVTAQQLSDVQDVNPPYNPTEIYDDLQQSTRSVQGVSASHFVTAILHLDVDHVTGIDVSNPVRTGVPPVHLSQANLRDGFGGGTLCDAGCQAVFQPWNDVGAFFFRPASSSTDPNFDDEVGPSAVGHWLQVAVATDNTAPLLPTFSVTPENPDPGQPVQFRVVAASVPPGTTLTWEFGDGSTAASANPTHTYESRGAYDVYLHAASSDRGGVSDAERIQVGPVTGDGTASTPQPADSAAGAGAGAGTGGNGSGGGPATTGAGSGGAGAAGTGAAKGSTTGGRGPQATPTTSATATNRSRNTIPRGSDRKPGAAANSTTSRARTAGATNSRKALNATAHTAGETAAAAAPTATTTTPPATPPAATSPSAQATTPAPSNSGAAPPREAITHISGLAVAGRGPNVAAALVAAEALAAAAPEIPSPQAAARAAAGHGVQIVGGLTGAAVIIGLLGFGAAQEMRRLPKRLPA